MRVCHVYGIEARGSKYPVKPGATRYKDADVEIRAGNGGADLLYRGGTTERVSIPLSIEHTPPALACGACAHRIGARVCVAASYRDIPSVDWRSVEAFRPSRKRSACSLSPLLLPLAP